MWFARAALDRTAGDHARRRQGHDAKDFGNELRSMDVTPLVAQNTSSLGSAIDGRTAGARPCRRPARLKAY